MNCKGDKLCDTHMNWNYKQRTCKISAPEHFKKLLIFFQNPTPKKTQQALDDYNALNYGQKQQCSKERETAKKLSPA